MWSRNCFNLFISVIVLVFLGLPIFRMLIDSSFILLECMPDGFMNDDNGHLNAFNIASASIRNRWINMV